MQPNLQVHFSSASAEWATPDDLFAELDTIFHFDLDACASPENAKCVRYFTKDDNALGKHWTGTVLDEPTVWARIQRIHGQGVRRVVPWFHRGVPGAK